MRRQGLAAAAALALGALLFALKPGPPGKWRAERDSIQAAAEAAERSSHPWAGVYLAKLHYNAGDAVCVAPNGDYYGALYNGWNLERVGHGLGRASVEGDRLVLNLRDREGADPAGRLSGAYRLVRWGDVRCLVRPGETELFVHCAARGEECKDFRPLCTRGYVHGEPELPVELARARREDPMYRPITVRSVSPPQRRNFGWSWRVELDAGRNEGLKEDMRLYWGDRRTWINVGEVHGRTATGEIQQSEDEGPRMGIALKSGMKVARWRPTTWGLPDFMHPMAEMRP